MATEQQVRIGELSRRTGVSPALLRAWERRYGLLDPARTEGGFRLYGPEDEQRVRDMQAALRRGLSAAEAARETLSGPGGVQDLALSPGPLAAALDEMDAVATNLVLDRLLATFTLETVLSEVLLPYLHELGERWSRGEASVGQEHFASNLLRARLVSLARGWGAGNGPLALLACAPGEQHDLPLVMFGLALRARGWRIVFLGADTPAASIREAAETLDPALIVVSAVRGEALNGPVEELADLGRDYPLAIAGAGASEEHAQRLGGTFLEGDPVSAAASVSQDPPPP
jgi:DNA-binding transcriptional MerR regulator